MKSELIKIAGSGSCFPREVTLLAGTDRPISDVLEPFSAQVLAFLDDFSRALRRDRSARQDSEAMALAFWCRRAHLLALKDRHCPAAGRTGRGKIFHLAPANVPMMFVYTWAIGLLAGNTGIVRISERTLQREAVQNVLRVFRELFLQEKNAAIRERTSLISYDRSDAVTEQILADCSGRVLWGGDETILHMQQIPMPEKAVELTFPDRVSLAMISEETLEKADRETLRNLVHRFYNDTYVMDQNGCSSPQTVIWLKKTASTNTASPHGDSLPDAAAEQSETGTIRDRWWRMLAQEAEREYGMDGFRAARKLEKAAVSAMQTDEIVSLRRFCGNELFVLRLADLPQDLAAYKGGFGLFFETEAEDTAQIFRSFSDRIQTVVCIGIDSSEQAAAAAQQKAAGALRFVEAGQALQMDTVWDGIDLINALSR